MDECIRSGVSAKESTLPGRLGLRRRAPRLYHRLMRGFYAGVTSPSSPAIAAGTERESIQGPAASEAQPMDKKDASSTSRSMQFRRSLPRVVGSFEHPLAPMPPVCA